MPSIQSADAVVESAIRAENAIVWSFMGYSLMIIIIISSRFFIEQVNLHDEYPYSLILLCSNVALIILS
jgi:hypothetical protein